MNVFLGGDVSKGYVDFVILDEKKQILEKNFQLDDTRDGHHKLYEILKLFNEKKPEVTIYAGLESTGGYENNWYNCLTGFKTSFRIQVARLNPLAVSANSRASLNRNTTDKISAFNIANFLISHFEKVNFENRASEEGLKKIYGYVKLLKKQKTQSQNHLTSLLYSVNPEILNYCKDGMPKWVLKLLCDYPTPKELKKTSTNKLKIPYLKKEIAEEIIRNAKKSVGNYEDQNYGNLIQELANEVLRKENQIGTQMKEIEEKYYSNDIEILKSFPGIDTTAIELLVNIGNIKRFATVKNLASFFGVHPVYKKSGDGAWGFHMSKKGNKEVRTILFMIALGSIKNNPQIKLVYENSLKKGMSKMQAIGVCMHKILRIIYGMLKNQEKYDPEIDRKNREKNERCKETTTFKLLKERRFQDLKLDVPISRRQNKYRKEIKASQNDFSFNAGSPSLPLQKI